MSGKRQRKRIEKRRRRTRSSVEHRASSSSAVPPYRHVERVEPLVYTRRQAAAVLGISLATLDRRLVPALNTVKTPSGTRLIPIAEIDRFLGAHTQVASVEFSPRRRAGRRSSVPQTIVERIQREHAEGKSLGEIARGLTASGTPTPQAGRRWWPSTVRGILARTRLH
jgi:Recombinase